MWQKFYVGFCGPVRPLRVKRPEIQAFVRYAAIMRRSKGRARLPGASEKRPERIRMRSESAEGIGPGQMTAVMRIIHTGSVAAEKTVVEATAVVANLTSAWWNLASTAICVMQGSAAWMT